MLYLLSQFLSFKLFGYITVRVGIAFFISLSLSLFLMPRYIRWAMAKKANQPINKFVPAHDGKKHTPTMGGAIFVLSAVIATLIAGNFTNIYLIGGLITIIGFAFVGFKDDYGKVASGNNLEGLTPKGKMGLLILISLIVVGILYYKHFPTTLYIPFLKTPLFDMHFMAIPFWILVFIATSNAVNLTDGLDGLATVPSAIALTTLGFIIYATGHAEMSKYLLIPHISDVGEVSILIGAYIGALIGFLYYNCYPAEIFMGDTGSLATGGLIAYLAIIAKSEVLLILIGAVFVAETVSVILQVGSYKLRGQRVFLMAPIHHHFELKKWAENKIIVRFWMVAFLANVLALITLKIR
ncbi:MAG: phospho-N-acetylmuramoyl-pentapeptide-transferase [Sulfurovaceae bacterium]|nr:phospho-N-acetylmuramoyl-pentapeptide-transferase [Sulfurovaceae bacterium]MDD5548436.1 phospho-N-acetylmuramoyl-pentapeptide-transferase [Sulfurovaceae bacterium]